MLVLGCSGALAASAATTAPQSSTTATAAELEFGAGSHERFAARVNTAQTTDYRAVLAAYDAHRASNPYDVVSAIERCRFMETFAEMEDGTIESAGDDLTACRDELKAAPIAGNVEVILYGVESSWGEKETLAAADLIPKSEYWTRQQRATLFELLAERNTWRNKELAASYAMQAVSLNPGSRVLMLAVDRWVQLGAKDKAHKILLAAPASTWEHASRVEAAKVLLDLGDADHAVKLLRGAKQTASDLRLNLALAGALAARGEFAAARERYREALHGAYVALETRIEYFEFEREHGTAQVAAAAYEQLRNQGFAADSMAHYRLSLFFSHPGIGWQWRDVLGVLAFSGFILMFCLTPLLVIVPVHYRGLALRVTGRAPVVTTRIWRLRDAWYALGVFLLAQFLGLYVFAPSYLETMLPWAVHFVTTPVSDRVLANTLLWPAVATLLLLAPLLRGKSIRTMLCGRWSILRSILVGIGFAILIKFAAYIFVVSFSKTGMLGSETTRAIQGVKEAYGLAGMLLLTSGVVPLVEEWVFRGVLLEAFRGHVSFLFAAMMQAAAFTFMHEEWQSMPFLFVFALAGAWLVKRSEGLLAPMAMHSANNLMATLTIIGATNVLNR